MSSLDLAKFEQLKATEEMPSPKGPALAIIRLIQREDVSMADLAHAVKADPAFVGRLIKAANSVSAGSHRAIASIQDALVVLGMPAVKALALGFSLLSEYRAGKCKEFDYKHFWSHSLACAVAFQWLMVRTRAAPPEDAFSVGLLCNIGRLALATVFPTEYSRLLGETRGKPVADLVELERQVLAMTHGELSAALMRDWGLPKAYVEPIMHHEQPEAGGFIEGSRPHIVVWSLALANHIANICTADDTARPALLPHLMVLARKLAIDDETIVLLCDKVVEEWRAWAGMLKVETTVVPPFQELLKPPQEASSLKSGAVAEPMRVIVVDDDAAVRALILKTIVDLGHQAFEAKNGREAFEMALDLSPHIIVADWVMPDLDGIEMTRALRETKVGRGIYILLVTGFEEDDRLIQAFEAGVDDFVAKPIRPRVLTARLRGAQRVVQLQREIEHDREEIRRFAAELAISNRRLHEVALTDPLTELPNRRYAVDRFQKEWAAVVRSGRPLACLVVDVDNFKTINDTHGHDAGDAALLETVAALKKGLRTVDTLARMGGDEFMVICPDTTLDAARTCAERLRKLVEAISLPVAGASIRGSVSIGYAVREEGMTSIDALIKSADEGLYLAKQAGRNRVATAQKLPLRR